MSDPENILIHNANVITLDPGKPRASGVVCERGIITSLHDSDVKRALESGNYVVMDCGGRTMLPGFIDSHVHFLAYASSLTAVDCSPHSVSSIQELSTALQARAMDTPPGGWVRGAGYDEFRLKERRHPTRHDLDPLVPDHPVKLGHRSGHGTVLNSRAMALAGITIETPEPLGGYIERDVETGEPTGLFIDLDDWLDDRLGPQPRAHEMAPAAQHAARLFLSNGITSFHDASPCNSLKRWEFFQSLVSATDHFPRAVIMPGFHHVREFVESGLGFGAGDDWLRVGHCKIILSHAGGTLQPSHKELGEMVRESVELGFPVAIHAVEEAEVGAAVGAIESARGVGPGHRIEHASICPPDLIARMKAANIMIVTQPGFIYHSGDRYLEQLGEQDIANLYPLKAWLDAGLPVAASSDAPVIPPEPLLGIQASVVRRARTAHPVSPEQGISAEQALSLNGSGGRRIGAIKKGAPADFAILARDPTQVPPKEIGDIEVWRTVVGGRVVSGRPGPGIGLGNLAEDGL